MCSCFHSCECEFDSISFKQLIISQINMIFSSTTLNPRVTEWKISKLTFWYEKRKLLFEYGHTLLNSGISLGFHTLPTQPVKQ